MQTWVVDQELYSMPTGHRFYWCLFTAAGVVAGGAHSRADSAVRFSVNSSARLGACFTTNNGSCVTNGFGAPPFSTEFCQITVLSGGTLETPDGFSTNRRAASITIGGTIAPDGASVIGGTVYAGTNTPSGHVVTTGSVMWWVHTASSMQYHFRICGSGWAGPTTTTR